MVERFSQKATKTYIHHKKDKKIGEDDHHQLKDEKLYSCPGKSQPKQSGSNYDYEDCDAANGNNESRGRYKLGYLYQWSAAKDICPTGWKLPSIEELEELVRKESGNDACEIAYGDGWHCDPAATNLKSDANIFASHDIQSPNGNPQDNFNAYLVGRREAYTGSEMTADFNSFILDGANFWTNTIYERFNLPFRVTVTHYFPGVYFYVHDKADGLSVRCIKK